MDPEQKVGAMQLSARLRGESPPVTRRLRVAEQTSLAELHAALQVAFGWCDGHLYTFQIRGWQFGDRRILARGLFIDPPTAIPYKTNKSIDGAHRGGFSTPRGPLATKGLGRIIK